MEIQKIFSEIDTDEKLYSVLLSEEELALFSEIQREYSFNFNIRKLGRNLRVAKEDLVSSSKSALGMQLNPTDVKSMARQMTMRDLRKKVLNPQANTLQVKKSYKPYSIDEVNKTRLRRKAAKGERAENIGFGLLYA